MIDFHTHTLLSDGCFVPSELVRRAWVNGYRAIALTDHVDASTIGLVLPLLVTASRTLGKYWPLTVLAGVELTHLPLEEFGRLTSYARRHGASIVIGHGETVSEPVLAGTNRAAIRAGVDILAHPGHISDEDARAAARRGVYLELTTRCSHGKTNRHVYRCSRRTGAGLILNTDSHGDGDLMRKGAQDPFLRGLGIPPSQIGTIKENARRLLARAQHRGKR